MVSLGRSVASRRVNEIKEEMYGCMGGVLQVERCLLQVRARLGCVFVGFLGGVYRWPLDFWMPWLAGWVFVTKIPLRVLWFVNRIVTQFVTVVRESTAG